MPFYTAVGSQKTMKNYQMVFNPKTEKYEYTHRIVANQNNIDNYLNTKNVIHHVDFNKLNNSPTNLNCKMTY